MQLFTVQKGDEQGYPNAFSGSLPGHPGGSQFFEIAEFPPGTGGRNGGDVVQAGLRNTYEPHPQCGRDRGLVDKSWTGQSEVNFAHAESGSITGSAIGNGYRSRCGP
eukprot:2042070-Pyramimonas_sp.AAC.1